MTKRAATVGTDGSRILDTIRAWRTQWRRTTGTLAHRSGRQPRDAQVILAKRRYRAALVMRSAKANFRFGPIADIAVILIRASGYLAAELLA